MRSFDTQSEMDQYIPFTAKDAVDRTDPLELQWTADAQLMLVSMGAESGMNPGKYPDGRGVSLGLHLLLVFKRLDI